MTSGSVVLAYGGTPYDASAYLKQLDIWLKVSDSIATFTVNLKRDGLDLTKFFADQTIQIKEGSAVLLNGYLDISSRKTDAEVSIHHRLYQARGRNVGQDLANKIINKVYKLQKADDIIENMLSTTGAEVTFTSPSSAPNTSYSLEDKYLVQAFAKILSDINYDGRVKDDKTWDMWAIGSQSSGITLKSVAGAADNNILKLEKGDFDALDLRNYIIVRGRKVADSWSEENAADLTKPAYCTLVDEYTEIKAGIASLKCTTDGTDEPRFSFDFPLYNHDTLDWSALGNDNLAFFVYQHSVVDPADWWVKVYLTDSANNIIKCMVWILDATWTNASVPIGINCDIHATEISDQGGKWSFVTGSSFNWVIKKIEFRYGSAGNGDYFIVDGISLPDKMLAIAEDASSQSSYKKREIVVHRTDIYTQAQLETVATSLKEKLKDPTQFLTVWAIGSAGISGANNNWIPGYTVVVNSPDDGINNVSYRMMQIHIQIADGAIMKGHDFIVELQLAKASSKLDFGSWSIRVDADSGISRELAERISTLERQGARGTDYYILPGRPEINEAHIEDGGVPAEKLSLVGFHIVEELTLTDNTPSAGYVTWSQFRVHYDGVEYLVATGNSNKTYLWWDKTTPLVMQESNTRPTLLDEDCLIAMNLSGTGYKLIMEEYLRGGVFAAGSIRAADAVFATAAIKTADIADAQITTAKIQNLACTTAKIQNAAITTLKLLDDAITVRKIAKYTRWGVVSNQENIIHTFGGDLYSFMSGDYSFNKNNLLLELTSGSLTRIQGHLILDKTYNPFFKAKCKWALGFNTDTIMFVGISTWGQPFAFTSNQEFVASTRSWTINTQTMNHLGLHSNAYGETYSIFSKGSSTNEIVAKIYKVAPNGTSTELASGSASLTEAKTLINFSFGPGSEETIPDGYAIRLSLHLKLDGIDCPPTQRNFITSPVKEWVIPTGNSITVYVWVAIGDTSAAFYYGYTSSTLTQNTRVKFNFTHVDFTSKTGSTALAYYPCKTVDTGDSFVIMAKWDNDEGKYYWDFNRKAIDAEDETWLHNDDLYAPPSTINDGYFEISAGATGSEQLYIYNFLAQEEWIV